MRKHLAFRRLFTRRVCERALRAPDSPRSRCLDGRTDVNRNRRTLDVAHGGTTSAATTASTASATMTIAPPTAALFQKTIPLSLVRRLYPQLPQSRSLACSTAGSLPLAASCLQMLAPLRHRRYLNRKSAGDAEVFDSIRYRCFPSSK